MFALMRVNEELRDQLAGVNALPPPTKWDESMKELNDATIVRPYGKDRVCEAMYQLCDGRREDKGEGGSGGV